MDREQTGPGKNPFPSLPAADAAMAVVILSLGLFLAVSGHRFAHRWFASPSRQHAPALEELLGILAAASGLLVVAWWVMALAMAVAAALLERSGRSAAARVTGKFSPAFMRRVAVAALGCQMLAAPVAGAAGPPEPDPSPRPAVAALWAPTAGDQHAPGLPRALRVLAAPAPNTAPLWLPRAPAVDPGTMAVPQLRGSGPADARDEVTVRPGDSLWGLAASRLGPLASDVDIAAEWPRIYQANRTVIGESPHLLHPGQVLRLPAGTER